MTTETLVTAQGKKQICCETTIELNGEQFEKLTDNNLAKRVDNITKDLHIDWAINVQSGKNILSVTRTTTGPIDDEYRHDLEIAAVSFMNAVEELQCDKHIEEDKCLSQEEINEEQEKKINFCKTLLKEAIPNDDIRFNIVEMIIPGTYALNGAISRDMMKEMLELYLKEYDK